MVGSDIRESLQDMTSLFGFNPTQTKHVWSILEGYLMLDNKSILEGSSNVTVTI